MLVYDLGGYRLRTTLLQPAGDGVGGGLELRCLHRNVFLEVWICGSVNVRFANADSARRNHGMFCGVSADGFGVRVVVAL